MSDKIEAIHGDVEAADFVLRHSRVMEPLAVVSSGTRRVTGSGADGLLSEDEKNGDSFCLQMVRQKRNPEARHKAQTLHHTARSFTPTSRSVPTQEHGSGGWRRRWPIIS